MPGYRTRDDFTDEQWEDYLDARWEAEQERLAEYEAGLDRPDLDEW